MARLASLSLFLLLLPAALAESTRPLLPLPVPGPWTKLGAPADPGRFVFAVGGDNRAAGRDVPAPPAAAEIFAELRLLRPEFALWTGDSIYGSDDTIGEARAEYAAFLSTAAAAEIPLFNAPGNHEIYNRPDMEALYEEAMGRTYGSFDYGNSHVIALDTEEVGRKPGIGPVQRAWLEKDLAANQGARNLFVFCHHPLFPTPGEEDADAGFADSANRDDIHGLFVRYRVKMVFSGHEHLFYESVHDGITYVVTGGGGAPADCGPERGGFQHYLLVGVNGGDVSLRVIEPWRLSEKMGPVMPDGSCAAEVDNYNRSALSVAVEFPSDALGAHPAPTASFTFKGRTRPLAASVVPSRRPGTTAVRVTVPAARSTIVVLAPAGR